MSPGYGRWEITWIGTIVAALIIEVINASYLHLWRYVLVWNIIPFLSSDFGLFGFIGWVLVWISAFSLTYHFSKRFYFHAGLAWVMSFLVSGLAAEIINSKILTMWLHSGLFTLYIIPYLDFSAVALLGWTAIGVVTLGIIWVVNTFYG